MTHNEKTVYHGKFIQIKEQSINGLIWEKAFFKGGIVILPITDKNEIILIEEFRPHETPNLRIKPVTGIYEPQYTWQENANREMQEEIGYKANTLEMILETQSTGSINSFQKFVIAKDLIVSKIPNPDGEDSIRKVIHLTFDQLQEAIWDEKIPWTNSMLGIFKLIHFKDRYLK